jgi:hypothetical protein
MQINWDDPAARAALIGRVGPKAYNEAFEKHVKDTTINTVGGHAIRPIGTRFGRLFQVGNSGKAFSNQEQAEKFAGLNPVSN